MITASGHRVSLGSANKQVRPLQPARALPQQQHHTSASIAADSKPACAPVTLNLQRRDVIASVPGLLSALVGSALLPSRSAAAAACEFISAPSGLQYCDVKVGEGSEPAKGSLIRCHYTGRLASNNRVFDSSYERGRPLTFKIGVREVIQGWDLGILGTEGVPAMKEGGKRVLLIPPELAYGSRGAGGLIPPNATLLFEVELLGKPGRR